LGFSPCKSMAKPKRNADAQSLRGIERTFFVTSKSIDGVNVFQLERMALLLIDVLRSYVAAKKFKVHDFVVMPDHVHVQLTVNESISIEKALQSIKGGFSYRAKKELGYRKEIWQRGFSEVRILNRSSFLKHRKYIEQNPVEAGLVDSPEKYPYSSAHLKWKKKRSG
jgi:putative transposase